MEKIRIAVVGLNFGEMFVPIYKSHPNVEYVGICNIDEAQLARIGGKYDINLRHNSLEEVIASGRYDAVHLNTPVPLHAQQSVKALSAGLHCACAIPMGMTLDELRGVIKAQRTSGKNYMMMETQVYNRMFMYVRDLIEEGKLGTITFARCSHTQDMEGWPAYWVGMPPMCHSTHALSPVFALLKARPKRVHCLGSGQLREDLLGNYSNPYPLETAIFEMEGSSVAIEATSSEFQFAGPVEEGFSIYGDRKGFHHGFFNEALLFTLQEPAKKHPDGEEVWGGRNTLTEQIDVPYRAELLPEPLRPFARGMHGGSHPHLAHEFVSSIIEQRKPWVNEKLAAEWTAAGICAHQSAMKHGDPVLIPEF